jgi:hypothetical protein
MRWKLPVDIQVIIPDEKWAVLKKYSGLPDEARPIIDEIITLYREHRPSEREAASPAALRSQILVARKQLEKLVINISRLGHTEDTVDAISLTCTGRTQKERTRTALKLIGKEIRELIRLGSHLKHAEQLIPKSTPGPRSHVLHFTINLLNAVLIHYTGKKLTRGTKEHSRGPAVFAAEVLRLADPQIKHPDIAVNKTLNLIKNDLIEWDDEAMAILRKNIEGARQRELP